jgi:hypothetical protein
MTAQSEMDRLSTVPAPTRVGQATVIEQSRAVAEVQAAVIVAQQCPRDPRAARDAMIESCKSMGLAERAFYSVPKRGSGPSVHLARELARIWGNVQYGVHELSRDDEGGVSEVQAFAWDVQTNTRSTRTFIHPHERMAGGKRQKLVDLGDIYLSNQNVGARAVRECIFSIMPPWLLEEAQETCHRTLREGGGKPLPQRISDAIRVFDGIGIGEEQVARRVGKPSAKWTEGDVARLIVDFRTVERGEVSADELFPPSVTAEEITGQGRARQSRDTPAAPAEPSPLPADPDDYDPTGDPGFGQDGPQ